MNPFAPSTIGGSTVPPVPEPTPTVTGEPASADPLELKPYSLPSEQPTNTLPVKKSTTGPLSFDPQATVTVPAVPQLVSMLGAGGVAPEQATLTVQNTFLRRTKWPWSSPM